ncbi:AraC family transcriptional regulator [Shewanella sp. C32]|uniref:AraC family transcriptional regulator n=1 Tax=Shewanella electrica TaxID=515560 RepID=A0ABT2FIV4_9GAMM|nr:AraC family transcriptional regulator [Shewanella electrica]MCH1924354.1 AraC family transcriptional regulator [Shewanella electrica]MCS4556255.1 AraC family transcriptional regulator [Shewanella electrica]
MAAPYQRIVQVCEYIQQHLDEALTPEQLSNIAACSRFHFHRLFVAHTGMSATRYIQLAKLKRASYQLAFEPLKVIDIALLAGFASPEAFARSFKKTVGQTPTAFRQQPDWTQWQHLFQLPHILAGAELMQVNIVTKPNQKIAYLSHLGAPERVLATSAQFIAWRKQTGLSPIASSDTFGIPYADPNTVAPDEFRFDIAGTIKGDVPANDFGVQTGTIPGGRFAVLRHYGSHDNLSDSVYQLYRDWLPQSGKELGDFPCFFHWLNFVHQVDECDLQTDIYLPLK